MTVTTLGLPVGGLFDLTEFLHAMGPWALLGIAAIVFIESGLLFPFLPGDSLLFTAGMLHQALGLNLAVLLAVIGLAAILGDQVGYFLGSRFGRRFFSDDARILKTEHLAKAEDFFTRYGGRSIVLARFVPIVRTYVPLVAGMVRYPYHRFIGWNILGGCLWTLLLTMAGVLLGHIPWVARNIELIAVVIVMVSVIPIALEILRARKQPAPAPKLTDHV